MGMTGLLLPLFSVPPADAADTVDAREDARGRWDVGNLGTEQDTGVTEGLRAPLSVLVTEYLE